MVGQAMRWACHQTQTPRAWTAGKGPKGTASRHVSFNWNLMNPPSMSINVHQYRLYTWESRPPWPRLRKSLALPQHLQRRLKHPYGHLIGVYTGRLYYHEIAAQRRNDPNFLRLVPQVNRMYSISLTHSSLVCYQIYSQEQAIWKIA